LWLKYNREFHTAIAELTQNTRLITILQDLHQIVQMVCYDTFKQNGRIDENFAEHDRIFDSMVQGRVAEAKRAMEGHLDQAMSLVLSIGKLKTED